MGYRVILKEEGTQDYGSIKHVQKKEKGGSIKDKYFTGALSFLNW